MAQTGKIPLVRAAVLEPVILAANKIGTPVDKLLRSVGLPTSLLDEPNMLVAELPAWQLASKIARMEAVPNFGLMATMELAHQDISSVHELLQGCTNLKGLLERIIQITPYQSSVNEYVLRYKDDYVWILQKGARLNDDFEQVELFEVAGMIQLVQMVMGENWRPPEIHFGFKYSRHVENAEMLNPSEIYFSQRYPGIAIPIHLLATEFTDYPSPDKTAGLNDDLIMPEAFYTQFQMAISPFVGARKLDKTLLSDLTGMSLRTLQRRLNECNTSYTHIVEQARFVKAQTLLKETNEKLVDISLMLGYENASSFTRAFLRWAGITPKAYRNIYKHRS